MKRLFLIATLCFMMIFASFGCVGCSQSDESTVEVYLPDGTPVLALAGMLDENYKIGGKTTNYHVVPASDVQSYVASGVADVALLPTIAAASTYKKGGEIQLLSSNVFGNLYIVGKNTEAVSLSELKGKTICTTTATTIQLLQYILKENQIEYISGNTAPDDQTVALYSFADGSEIIGVLSSATTEIFGVLGEPQVTKCLATVGESKIVFDLQKEWQILTGKEGYPQASVVAQKSFVQNNAQAVEDLIAYMQQNSNYAEQNVAKLGEILSERNSTIAKMNFTATTITRCNLGFEKAVDVKDSVIEYVSALNSTLTLQDDFFYASNK